MGLFGANTFQLPPYTGRPLTAADIDAAGGDPVCRAYIAAGGGGGGGGTGPAGTITVGTVTTGAPGSSASVVNVGTSTAAILNFTLPAGTNGTNGTGATVAVGTVTTGAPGSSATVTNSGTARAAIFDFVIPQGATGGGGGGGGSGTVTSVLATAPLASDGNTVTPTLSIAAATTGARGTMSAADKTKLDGVATGATANATDAALRDRSTHTGTQGVATITGLGTAAVANTGVGSSNVPVLGTGGLLTVTGVRAQSSANGYVQTDGGTLTITGFVQFFMADDTLHSYIGYSTALQPLNFFNNKGTGFSFSGGTFWGGPMNVNTQTASYTLALVDRQGYVRTNVAAANNVTIPTNATVAFEIGTQITVKQVGAGKTTIVAASGVTITDTNKSIPAQFGAVTLVKVATNTWDIVGATIA